MRVLNRDRSKTENEHEAEEGRPRPDEAPEPQPEREEPRLEDPGLTDLSKRDYLAVVQRAAKEAMADNIPNLAAALAYYGFLAIPSLLLVAVGVFGLVADPSSVQTVVDKLGSVAPAEATSLVRDSLNRMVQQQSGANIAVVVIGSLVALWSLTGAMQTVQWALNTAYEREETRGFVRRRLVALAMLIALGLAFLLVFALLVLGPALSGWIGDAIGAGSVFDWLWWTAQWPVLIVGLLLAFAFVLFLGPNVEQRRWSFLTPGSAIAVVIWLLASGGFALYVSSFGSYNKAWGSLAAVVIMLTWLWLSALALLFGAEVNAELERSRELRQRRS
jgi:membrane protein